MEKEYIKNNCHPFYKQIELISETESTNDDLKKIAELKEAGYVLISNHQTGGKGRNGKTFYSSRGKGIYLSLLLKPNVSAQKVVLISAVAAVACVKAIKEIYNLDAKIKWVNDLYLSDKKVTGILCESALQTGSNNLEYLIMGIGINVHQINFPQEIEAIATSIEEHTPKVISREKLIVSFLNHFYDLYTNLDSNELLDLYRQYSNVIGKEITIYENNNTYKAKAIDITEDGFLIVENKWGKLVTLSSGEITIRT